MRSGLVKDILGLLPKFYVGRDPYDFGRLTTSLTAVQAYLLTQAPKYFVGGHGAKVSNDATLPKRTLAHKIRLGFTRPLFS